MPFGSNLSFAWVDNRGTDIFIGGFDEELPPTPQWGNVEFDCFVLLDERDPPGAVLERLAAWLAAARTDWVEVLGKMSERLHDAIDAASVSIGRQRAAGDGSPMTGWDDTVHSVRQVVEYIAAGGQGWQSVKVVIVLGTWSVDAVVTAFEQYLSIPPTGGAVGSE